MCPHSYVATYFKSFQLSHTIQKWSYMQCSSNGVQANGNIGNQILHFHVQNFLLPFNVDLNTELSDQSAGLSVSPLLPGAI